MSTCSCVGGVGNAFAPEFCGRSLAQPASNSKTKAFHPLPVDGPILMMRGCLTASTETESKKPTRGDGERGDGRKRPSTELTHDLANAKRRAPCVLNMVRRME